MFAVLFDCVKGICYVFILKRKKPLVFFWKRKGKSNIFLVYMRPYTRIFPWFSLVLRHEINHDQSPPQFKYEGYKRERILYRAVKPLLFLQNSFFFQVHNEWMNEGMNEGMNEWMIILIVTYWWLMDINYTRVKPLLFIQNSFFFQKGTSH